MHDGNEIVCRVQTDLGIETPLYSLCSGLPSLRMGRTKAFRRKPESLGIPKLV